MLQRFPLQKFMKFLVIGALGFVVDAAVFQSLCLLHFTVAAARFIAFAAALTATFFLNRAITYNQTHLPLLTQYAKYVLASSTGGAINLASFFILFHTLPIARLYPLATLFTASLAGLVANFTLYTIYVFGTRSTTAPAPLD